jgi:hypothetical protein
MFDILTRVYLPQNDLHGYHALDLTSLGSNGSGTDRWELNRLGLCTLLRFGNAWYTLSWMD